MPSMLGVCAQRRKHCTVFKRTCLDEAKTYVTVAIGMAYEDFGL